MGLALGDGVTAQEERKTLDEFVGTKEQPMPLIPNYAANLSAWQAMAALAASLVSKDADEQAAFKALLAAEDEAAVAALCTHNNPQDRATKRNRRMDAALRVIFWQAAAQRAARTDIHANTTYGAVCFIKAIAKMHVRKAAEVEAIYRQLMTFKMKIPIKMPTAVCVNAILEVVEAKVARIDAIIAADQDYAALAVPVKHVTDRLVALINNIQEFKDDHEYQAKITTAKNKYPLRLGDIIHVITERAGATPDRPVTLVEDSADVNVVRATEEVRLREELDAAKKEVQELEKEVRHLKRKAQDRSRESDRSRGAGKEDSNKQSSWDRKKEKWRKTPCKRHFDPTTDGTCKFNDEGNCNFSHDVVPDPVQMKAWAEEGTKQGRKIIRKLEGSSMVVAAVRGAGTPAKQAHDESDDEDKVQISADYSDEEFLHTLDEERAGAVSAVQGAGAPPAKRRRVADRLGTKGKPNREKRAEPQTPKGGTSQVAMQPPVCGRKHSATGKKPGPCTGTQDTYDTNTKMVRCAVRPQVSQVHAEALRDSGSQRHIVPETVPMMRSRPTRQGEGEYSGYTGHRQQAEAIGTLWLYDPASMIVVKLSNVLQKQGCMPIINDNRFQDETRLHFRRAPGRVGEYYSQDRIWKCAKGEQGSEYIRGMPVTKTGAGGMAVSDLPVETVHWSEADGEYVPMFPRSAAKQARGAKVYNVTSDGKQAWRGSPRVTVTEDGQAVKIEEASNRSVAEALKNAQEADVVFGWLPKLQLRSIKRALAKMWLSRKQIYCLDREEISEMFYLHHCMGHPNWRRLAQYAKRANVPIRGKRDQAFCDACAQAKVTSEPKANARTVQSAVRQAREHASLWEYASYDVAGEFRTAAIDGGGKYEFHAVCHATNTRHVAGFMAMGDLYDVMETFLCMASAARASSEEQRAMNLLVETPQGHRDGQKWGRMKSDFHLMHRSKRMRRIMQNHNMERVLVAPEMHHRMGKVERGMRTVHEAADAVMTAANLPPKYRLEAVKAVIRCGDYLPTKANPESFSPRAMRRVLAGVVDPAKVHEQMIPAIPFGVPACGKRFNAGKEANRGAGAAVYAGFDEDTRTHKLYYDNVPGHKKNFMQHTPHCTFDLTLPVRAMNHPTVVVGCEDGEVQAMHNAHAERYADPLPEADRYELDAHVINDSDMMSLSKPDDGTDTTASEQDPRADQTAGQRVDGVDGDAGAQSVPGADNNDAEGQDGAATAGASDMSTEAADDAAATAPDAGGAAPTRRVTRSQNKTHQGQQHPSEAETDGGSKDQGEPVQITKQMVAGEEDCLFVSAVTANALRTKGEWGSACKNMLGRNSEGQGKATAQVRPVIGEIYKNWDRAKEHVISIDDPKERANSWDMLMKGRMKEFNKMEEKGVMESILYTDIPAKHRQNKWVLRSLRQYHQKGDEDNNVSEWKARWCIDGSTAVKDVHFDQTSSPTPRPEATRAVVAEAAMQLRPGDKDAALRQGDIPSAHTHWDQPAEHDVYFRAPHGEAPCATTEVNGVKTRTEIAFKLKKALYGMPSAGYIHYCGLRKFLETTLHLTTGEHDQATWTWGVRGEAQGEKAALGKKAEHAAAQREGKAGAGSSTAADKRSQKGKAVRFAEAVDEKSARKGEPVAWAGNDQVRMVIWVDDILYFCKSKEKQREIEEAFNLEFGDCGWKPATFFAGVNIKTTCAADTDDAAQWGVKLSNETLTELIHMKHGEKGLVRPKQRDTPVPEHWVASPGEADPDKSHERPFVRLVGALAFIAQSTRFDMAFAAGQNQRIQARPTKMAHKQLTTWTLEYAYATRDRGVMYKAGDYMVRVSPTETETFAATELTLFTDSSHADTKDECPCAECYTIHKLDWKDNDAMKSTIAHVMMYAGAPISWGSRTGGRHDSTTRSELEAACEGTTRVPVAVASEPHAQQLNKLATGRSARGHSSSMSFVPTPCTARRVWRQLSGVRAIGLPVRALSRNVTRH